LYWM